MSLFQYLNYRKYLRDYIHSLNKKGRGELTKIAAHLGVNTTLLSQVLSGSRDFSLEQTISLCAYLDLTDLETDYFSTLVQLERAGTEQLRNYLKKKLENLRKEGLKLSRRILHEKTLDDVSRAHFYASWIYSAIHLFTSTQENGVSLEEISNRFRLSRAKVIEAMQFLINAGLCDEINNKFRMKVQSTFIEKGSPFLSRHHANWRMKSIQKSESIADTEMIYTSQVSLSRRDFDHIREGLSQFVKDAMKRVVDSPPEDLACLNIDWFWIES